MSLERMGRRRSEKNNEWNKLGKNFISKPDINDKPTDLRSPAKPKHMTQEENYKNIS